MHPFRQKKNHVVLVGSAICEKTYGFKSKASVWKNINSSFPFITLSLPEN
jgi:hypothetical protein